MTIDYNDLAKIGSVLKQHPEMNVDFMTSGQLKSKLWLIEELNKFSFFDPVTIFVMAGWYGMLPYMLFRHNWDNFNIEKIRSFDVDPECQPIADLLNDKYINGWKFKASTADINRLYWDKEGFCTYQTNKPDNTTQKLYDKPDIIINTSCEHIDHFQFWLGGLPKDTLLVLQSNDLEIDEHINRATSICEFEDQTNLSKVYFSGKLTLSEAGYTRYMIIGEK